MSIGNLANTYTNTRLNTRQRYNSFNEMIKKLQETINKNGNISFHDWNRVNYAYGEMYTKPSFYGYGKNRQILSPIKNKINEIRRATSEKEEKKRKENKKRRDNLMKSVRNEHPKYKKMFREKRNKRISTSIYSMNKVSIPKNVQKIIMNSAIPTYRERVNFIKKLSAKNMA